MSRPDVPSGPPPGGAGGDPLSELFARARDQQLSPDQMTALWSKVSAAAAAAGGGAAAGASAASIKVLAAWIVGGGIVAAAAGSHYLRGSAGSEPASVHLSASAGPVPASVHWTATADPASGRLPPSPGPEPGLVAAPSPMPQPASVDVTSLPVASDRSREPAEPGAASQKAPALGRTPTPRASDPNEAWPGQSGSSPVAPGARPGRGVWGGDPQGQNAPPVQADLAAPAPAASSTEAALLLRARRTLASDPTATLALTEEHARRFPTGALVPEREVLAIEALAALGRTSEARQRLDVLRARFPNAANVAGLDRLIGQ